MEGVEEVVEAVAAVVLTDVYDNDDDVAVEEEAAVAADAIVHVHVDGVEVLDEAVDVRAGAVVAVPLAVAAAVIAVAAVGGDANGDGGYCD